MKYLMRICLTHIDDWEKEWEGVRNAGWAKLEKPFHGIFCFITKTVCFRPQKSSSHEAYICHPFQDFSLVLLLFLLNVKCVPVYNAYTMPKCHRTKTYLTFAFNHFMERFFTNYPWTIKTTNSEANRGETDNWQKFDWYIVSL